MPPANRARTERPRSPLAPSPGVCAHPAPKSAFCTGYARKETAKTKAHPNALHHKWRSAGCAMADRSLSRLGMVCQARLLNPDILHPGRIKPHSRLFSLMLALRAETPENPAKQHHHRPAKQGHRIPRAPPPQTHHRANNGTRHPEQPVAKKQVYRQAHKHKGENNPLASKQVKVHEVIQIHPRILPHARGKRKRKSKRSNARRKISAPRSPTPKRDCRLSKTFFNFFAKNA